MTSPEEARREQLQYGRLTLRAEGDTARPERITVRPRTTSMPPKVITKGHDSILRAMQENLQKATIITAEGVEFVGVITGRDKYTITLKTLHPVAERAVNGEFILRVFYKSAIEQFWGEHVPRTQAAAVQ